MITYTNRPKALLFAMPSACFIYFRFCTGFMTAAASDTAVRFLFFNENAVLLTKQSVQRELKIRTFTCNDEFKGTVQIR